MPGPIVLHRSVNMLTTLPSDLGGALGAEGRTAARVPATAMGGSTPFPGEGEGSMLALAQTRCLA